MKLGLRLLTFMFHSMIVQEELYYIAKVNNKATFFELIYTPELLLIMAIYLLLRPFIDSHSMLYYVSITTCHTVVSKMLEAMTLTTEGY
jgi:hypothetical protein